MTAPTATDGDPSVANGPLLGRVWAAHGPLLLALGTLLCFLPCAALGFVYDDLPLIADNPYLQDFDHLGRAFGTHLWDTQKATGTGFRYYRPLVALSYILDWQLGGGSAWSFHLTNILFHGLAVFLAARLSRRWLGEGWLWTIPVLLFALHPTRLESVAWVSGRTDVMMTAFALLAVETAHQARLRSPHRGLFLGLSVASNLAALLCKETAVVLPLVILADTLRARRRAATSEPQASSAVLLTGLVSVCYLAWRTFFYPVHVAQTFELSPSFGLLTTATYLKRLLWPYPQTFFVRPVVVVDEVPISEALELAAGAAGICAFCFAWWRFRRQASVWLLLAAGASLAPLLNFVDSGLNTTASDRFLYFGLLPFAIFVVVQFQNHINRLPSLGVATAVVLVTLTTAFSNVLAFERFSSNTSYLAEELRHNPKNPVALESLGAQHANRGELVEARRAMREVFTEECRRQWRLYASVAARVLARLQAIEAALTADGDVEKLEKLLSKLLALNELAHSNEPRTKPSELTGIPAPALEATLRAEVPAADAAVLAARLGYDALARRLLEGLSESDLSNAGAPAQLVVAWLRLGQPDQARTLATRVFEASNALDETTRLALTQQILSAKALLARPALAGELVREKEAAYLGGLGAYLRGLRVLYPERHTDDNSRLYVQLLVSARLETEALRELTPSLGRRRATEVISGIRAALGSPLNLIPPVEAPASWQKPPHELQPEPNSERP